MNEHLIVYEGDDCYYRHTISKSECDIVFSTHTHDSIELFYILKGSVIYRYEGTTLELGEGDLIITPPHCYHSTELKKDVESERIIMLINHPFELNDAAVYSSNELFQALFKSIENYYNIMPAEDYPRLFKIKTDEIILVLNQLSLSAKRRRIIVNSKIASILDYINENIKGPITPKSVSKACFISEGYLQRLFKKELNITPGQYILSKKLSLAKFMILNSDEKISSISYKLGFEDYSVFYRCFVKHFNISPSKLKKIKTNIL